MYQQSFGLSLVSLSGQLHHLTVATGFFHLATVVEQGNFFSQQGDGKRDHVSDGRVGREDVCVGDSKPAIPGPKGVNAFVASRAGYNWGKETVWNGPILLNS